MQFVDSSCLSVIVNLVLVPELIFGSGADLLDLLVSSKLSSSEEGSGSFQLASLVSDGLFCLDVAWGSGFWILGSGGLKFGGLLLASWALFP